MPTHRSKEWLLFSVILHEPMPEIERLSSFCLFWGFVLFCFFRRKNQVFLDAKSLIKINACANIASAVLIVIYIYMCIKNKEETKYFVSQKQSFGWKLCKQTVCVLNGDISQL